MKSTKPMSMWSPIAIPDQAPAAEAVADLAGAKLWYWDTGGKGAPVIFLHAGTQSGQCWLYQQPVFAKSGFRAIGYSRRSYFGSEPGPETDPGYASEDLHNLIAYLQLDKVHLVALAHGGFFAVDYVLSHPDRVHSLSIVSSLMGIADDDYKAVNQRIRPEFFSKLPHDFQELGPSYRAGNPEGVEFWNKLTHDAIPQRRVTQKLVNAINWKALRSITVPTLLMTGDADLYVPPALARMQAAHVPKAQFSIISEAGHSANWEQPEEFNRRVIDFISRH